MVSLREILYHFITGVHYYTYESRNEHALCKIKPTTLVNDENLHTVHQKKDLIFKE